MADIPSMLLVLTLWSVGLTYLTGQLLTLVPQSSQPVSPELCSPLYQVEINPS